MGGFNLCELYEWWSCVGSLPYIGPRRVHKFSPIIRVFFIYCLVGLDVDAHPDSAIGESSHSVTSSTVRLTDTRVDDVDFDYLRDFGDQPLSGGLIQRLFREQEQEQFEELHDDTATHLVTTTANSSAFIRSSTVTTLAGSTGHGRLHRRVPGTSDADLSRSTLSTSVASGAFGGVGDLRGSVSVLSAPPVPVLTTSPLLSTAIMADGVNDLRSYIFNTITDMLQGTVTPVPSLPQVGPHGGSGYSRSVVPPTGSRVSLPVPARPSGSQRQSRPPPPRYLPARTLAAPIPTVVVQPPLDVPVPVVESVGSLPPLPHRFIQQIQRGEFIDFDSLFSSITSHSGDQPGYTVTFENPTPDLGDASLPCIAVVPRRAASVRIDSFISWMLTWNEYVAVLTHFRPYLLPQLIRYQQVITRHARTYPRASWLAYESACRRLLANNPTMSWDDVVDSSEVFNTHLRSSNLLPHNIRQSVQLPPGPSSSRSSPGQGLCFTCGRGGHFSRTCPSKVGGSESSGHTSGFRAPQRSSTGLCFTFNDLGACHVQNCRWGHRCSLCNGGHPRLSCKKGGRKY